MLSNQLSAVFLVRMIYETCHVFDIGYQHNAGAYSLLAKQEIGKTLMNIAKEIDIDAFNKAEKDYLSIIERSRNEKEKENKKKEMNHE